MLKVLSKLRPDFYPLPCLVQNVGAHEWTIEDLPDDGSWLTKSDLLKLYFGFDHSMHVGTLTRRAMNATAISRETLQATLLRTAKLINSHMISLAGSKRVIMCQANAMGESPRIYALNHT